MICEDPQTMTNCTLISKSIGGSTSSDVVLAFWHLFMWFWTSGFVNAIGVMVVAGTIGKWYFKKEEEKSEVGSTTLLQALCCVLTYHLGSVAYGSLVIAVIQLIRSINDQKISMICSASGSSPSRSGILASFRPIPSWIRDPQAAR